MTVQKYRCSNCDTVIRIEKDEDSMTKIKKTKCCGNKTNLILESSELSNEERESIIERFKDPDLMFKIAEELEKDHLNDNYLKITAFLVAVSSMLENPRLRQSIALTGDTSSGKDNLTITIFKHMPESLFLTGATQPAMEDEAMGYSLIGLSEMNLFREGGANKGLIEVVKQRTEGGTSNIKKDAETQFKKNKYESTEQGTVFYGTTDAERNNEMETRFIFGHVSSSKEKVERVNKHTALIFSEPSKLIESSRREESWIKKGLRILQEKNKRCQVLIPFAPILAGKNKDGESIIDTSSPRSMRDFKRLLSLICARTWLYSEQRKRCQIKGVNFIVSSPEDVLEVIKDTEVFFNQTYSGLDERLNRVLKIVDESFANDWVARDSIEKKMGVHKNTIKAYCNNLADMGVIEGTKGEELNKNANANQYHSSKIYYKRCQKGVKKKLIRCEYSELKELLEEEENKFNEGEG